MSRTNGRLRPGDAAEQSTARAALRFAAGAYLVFLHAALLVLVFKTNFLLLAGETLGVIPPQEWNQDFVARVLEQAETDMTVPPGQVVLVGDSIMAQMDARLLGSDAVNFGIPGDTTHTLFARLPVIRSLQAARAVVLEVGVNDLKFRPVDRIARDYEAVLARLPVSPPVLAVSVLPVDEHGPAARQRPYLRNERIAALNSEVRRACAARARCRFVDAWPAMADSPVHAADGWHLSAEGNRVLADLIRAALPAPE